MRPVDQSMIPGGRVVFAHLKLRADPIEADALDNSPTIKALGEQDAESGWLQRATTNRDVGSANRAAERFDLFAGNPVPMAD